MGIGEEGIITIDVMKKLLEVVQYDKGDIRFETDVDVMKDLEIVQSTVIDAMFSMTTSLWGGNEQSVLAMLRALTIADLAISVNRKEMIRWLDQASESFGDGFRETQRMLEKRGKIKVFGAGVKKPTGAN